MQEIGCFSIQESVNFRVQNLSFKTDNYKGKWMAEFLFFTFKKAKVIGFKVFLYDTYVILYIFY